MSEDMSDMIKNLSGMLQGKEIPADVQNMLSNFMNSNSNSNNNSNSSNDTNENQNTSQESTNSDMPDIDIGMLLKMKDIMSKMKSEKNDPRSNLLRSLKPYLKPSRQDKVEQYIKLFNMGKVIEVINPLGGDKKNDL